MDNIEITDLANALGEKEARLIRLHASCAAFLEIKKMIDANAYLIDIKTHVQRRINTLSDKIEIVKGKEKPKDHGLCKHEYLLLNESLPMYYRHFSPCIHCGHLPD
jgi:hypothetical protein